MTRTRSSLKALLALAAVSSAAAQKLAGNVDYVIIGGGPAGFVVAEQLSRNANVTVTLVEAGPDGSQDPIINGSSRMPQGMQRILLTETSARVFHRGGSIYFAIQFTARSQLKRPDPQFVAGPRLRRRNRRQCYALLPWRIVSLR